MSEIPDNVQKIKAFVKKVTSKFLKVALIIIALFTAIIILLGSMYDALMENFSEKVSNYVQERPVEYDITDGSIVINEELIKELRQILEDTGIDLNKLNITDEHIEKMYAAEVVSQEINRGVPEEEGKYYGRVYVKKLTNPDTLGPMNYVPSVEEFKRLGEEEILNSYSIEEDKLWLASVNKITDKDGNIISEEIIPTAINYKNYIAQYTMPFEFLADLAAITRNIEFVMAIADKVLDETEIQIAVMQEETTTETTVNSTWTEVYESYTQVITKTTDPNTNTTITTGGEKYYDDPKETPKEESKEEIEININPTINVVSAKTWIMDIKQSYSKVTESKETNIPEDAEENKIEPSPLPDYSDTPIGQVQGVGTNKRTQTHKFERTYKKDEKKSIHIIEKTTSYKQSGSVVENDKAKEIVELLNTRYNVPGEGKKSAIGNLKSGFNIFINMLRKSSRTEKLENIMRYIMYVATGNKKYGVTSLDFSIYDPQYFTSFDGISNIDGVEGQIIDFLYSKGVPVAGISAIMGNIQRECSFNIACRNSSNHIGICQWDWNVRGAELRTLAEQRGVTWEEDLNVQLDFMWYELTNKSTYSKVYDVIMNATDEEDLEYAVWYFDRYYEVAILGNDFETGKESNSCKTRYNYAKEWYKKLQETSGKLYQGADDFYTLDNHKFPHYMQKNYPESYPIQLKDKTLSSSGCGPISLSMILSGMLNDPTITPVTLIEKLDKYYNGNWRKYYSYNGGTIGNNLFNTGFLQACYNPKLNVRSVSSQETAINEIAAGKCANGHVTGHFLAVIPPPGQYKGKGYKFFILDSINKLTGPYRSIEEVRKKNSSFKIQRIIEFVD